MSRLATAASAALLALGLSLPLAACAGAARTPAPASKTGFTTAQQKANGSGVTLDYQVQPAAAAGQAAHVTLVLDGVTDPAGASVRITADGGLTLLQDGGARALPAGSATTLEIDVVPQGTAAGYLNVFTTQYGITSVSSVRVGAGTGAAASYAKPTQTPEGERLIVLPVK